MTSPHKMLTLPRPFCCYVATPAFTTYYYFVGRVPLMGFPIVISHFSRPPKPKRAGLHLTQVIEMADYCLFFDLAGNIATKECAKRWVRHGKKLKNGLKLWWIMAGVTGLEPATSGVTGRRSNQLSYTPLKGKLSSNAGPTGCQAATGLNHHCEMVGGEGLEPPTLSV